MVGFIDQHRDAYGVEPICAVLPIAPSTYFLRKAQQQDPTTRSPRARRDEERRAAIQRVWDENDQVYGPRKVWRQLRREGVRVARCTVERLMRDMGLRGVVRGRAWKITTQSAPTAARPTDLVDRQFHGDAAESALGRGLQCAAASGVGDERRRTTGLSHSACRSRVQTTASGLGQKPRS